MRNAETPATRIVRTSSQEQTGIPEPVGRHVEDPITIVDEATGTSASILTAVGFNCFSFKPVVNGTTLDVIWAEPDFGPESALSLHGIPMLFPFAGRLNGTSFEYRGERFEVTGGLVAGGNVIHGFVISRPWRVVARSASEVTGEFHAAIDDPTLLDQWPADFCLRVTYRVNGPCLECDVVIEDPDDKPLPFGFGTHPYFRLPVGPGSKHQSVTTIPANDFWVHEGGLPSGEIAKVYGPQDFRSGKAFPEVTWDGVLTNLAVEDDGLVHTIVENRDPGYRIEQTFAPAFRNAVVWVPPHREAIAVEPWTTVPNAFELGHADNETGLIVLAPGESWGTRITITASTISHG